MRIPEPTHRPTALRGSQIQARVFLECVPHPRSDRKDQVVPVDIVEIQGRICVQVHDKPVRFKFFLQPEQFGRLAATAISAQELRDVPAGINRVSNGS